MASSTMSAATSFDVCRRGHEDNFTENKFLIVDDFSCHSNQTSFPIRRRHSCPATKTTISCSNNDKNDHEEADDDFTSNCMVITKYGCIDNIFYFSENKFVMHYENKEEKEEGEFQDAEEALIPVSAIIHRHLRHPPTPPRITFF